MLDIVRAWVRNLAFLVVFVTIAEMLLPAGEMRKFVRFVLGLVLILAIVNPLADLVTQGRWSLSLMPSLLAWRPEAPSTDWEEEAAAVNARGQAAAVAQYQAGLSAQMRGFLSLRSDLQPVAVEPRIGADGQVDQIRVHMSEQAEQPGGSARSGEEPRAARAMRVRRLLADLYGIDPAQIEVIWVGAGRGEHAALP